MKIISNRSVNTKFNIIAALLLTALFLCLAYNSYRREQALILITAVDNARSIARQIIETRDYLSEIVTNEPEHNYNLVPQVAATRIAKRLTSGSHYYVRQVSLRYRNPDNRPDSFETAQLAAFRDAKAKEVWQVAGDGAKKALRYLLPMKAEPSCLACHGSYDSAPRFVRERFPRGHYSYGYQVGEVIGAVSVSVPMGGLYREIGANLEHDLIYDGAVLLALHPRHRLAHPQDDPDPGQERCRKHCRCCPHRQFLRTARGAGERRDRRIDRIVQRADGRTGPQNAATEGI